MSSKYYTVIVGNLAQLVPGLVGLAFGATPVLAQLPDSLRVPHGEFTRAIYGASTFAKTGWAAASGDVNGDQLMDLVVSSSGASPLGRPEVGEIEIFWGGTTYPSLVDLGGPSLPISRIIGVGPYIGYSMAMVVGDFDGDGIDDVAIGQSLKPPFVNADGLVTIVFGAASFPDAVDLASDSHRITRIMPAIGTDGWFGLGLAAGDFDGDGIEDLVASQPAPSGGCHVYLVYGAPDLPPSASVASDAGWFTRIRAASVWEALGDGLAVGDINGDGKGDLILGSGAYTTPPGGKVTIVFGRSDRPEVIDLATSSTGLTTVHPDLGFMMHVGTVGCVAAGDINGDGVDDVVLSDRYASSPDCQECGAVFVILGGQALPSSINLGHPEVPVLTWFGTRTSFNYGSSVLAADLTGDGNADVVATHSHVYQTGTSEVTVHYGPVEIDGSAPDYTSPVTRIMGLPSVTEFGRALAAVDVNNDHVADLAVGAFAASVAGKSRAGHLYVFAGQAAPTAVSRRQPGVVLEQNYPNPFNPLTTIRFSLERRGRVALYVYDVTGYLVRTILDEDRASGNHVATWDGRDNRGSAVSSGVYLCRLRLGHLAETKKMVLLR